MPIFTAAAAAATAVLATVGAALGGTVGAFMIMNAGAIAAFAGRTLLTIGISKLVANRANSKAAGSQDAGARIQLAPSTDNKIPVIYGSAYIEGVVTDAKLSTDNKTMWYVVALAEHTDTTAGSGYTFDEVYYDNKLVTFDGTDPAKVISLTTNTAGTPQVDTKIAGNLFIYKFTNGSSSGVNTGGQSAITLLSDSDIPSEIRWNSSLYTSNGQSATMTNTAFVIVKVVYNQDAGTTNLGSVKVKLTNSLTQPGSVIKDYLLNTRYGCGLPLAKIDTTSLTLLDTYSAQNITYIPVGGGSATQARYTINGPVNTGLDCLSNLQQLVDACDSWLQYSELTGQWRVVINRSYTDTTTLGALYSVTSDNLIGGIEVNPLDLNSTYNEMEVQYPNINIKDQTDFQVVSLFTSYPSLLSPNEAINKLIIQLPQVNNAVQAKYLGLRRLLQGREDLVISFATDYSGIQVEAGDVIKVTLPQYGWSDKLFRVNYVGEEKYPDGSLGARMTAFEYNDTIYLDNSIQDFIPADNTGLIDPNIISIPDAPIATMDLANTIATITVTGNVPATGQIMYMDINYGSNSNVDSHLLYKSISGNGEPLIANTNVGVTITDLPAGNYWFSTTAKTNQVGVKSPSLANISNVSNFPGPTVTTYDGNSNTGGITTNNIANLSIVDSKIANNTITGSKVANNTITGNNVANYTITSNNLSNTGITAGSYTSVNISVGTDGRITTIANGTGGNGSMHWDQFADRGKNQYPTGAGSNIADPVVGGGPTGFLLSDIARYANGNLYTYLATANDYNPWFQNTATTANGFIANSTGTLTPTGARYQEMSETFANGNATFNNTTGVNGWWEIFSQGTPLQYESNLNLQVIANTAHTIICNKTCEVQLSPFYQYSFPNTVLFHGRYVDYGQMTSVTLVGNVSRQVNLDFFTTAKDFNDVWSGSNVYISGTGVAMRILTSNANVFITHFQGTLNDPLGNSLIP